MKGTLADRWTATDPVIDMMFRNARSIQEFDSASPPADAIPRIEKLTYLGPTSMNAQPLRIAWLRSEAAQDRSIAHIDDKNKAKALSAPLIAVLCADRDWHDTFDVFAPYMADRRELFVDDLPRRELIANDNAHLQAGYFILAVRAIGLGAGPMSGFDPRGMAREFDLPASWRPFLVVNIGSPAASEPQFPRLPRMNDSDRATLVL